MVVRDFTLAQSTFREVGNFYAREERVPKPCIRSRIRRFSRVFVDLLFEIRIMAAEIVFTLAALYGIYQAYLMLKP